MGIKWKMKPIPGAGLMDLGASRAKPKEGDVFVGNLRGKRWIVGRVVRTGLHHPWAKPFLVYFYKATVADPSDIHTPLAPDLLLPPMFQLRPWLWSDGLVRTVLNAPLRPEELLHRHVFRRVMEPHWVDENQQPVKPPGPKDVPGECSFDYPFAVDYCICKALKVRRTALPPPKRSDHGVPESLGLPTGRTPEVWLFIKPNDVLDFGEFDDECGDALRAAKLARSSGRGCDLESGVRDAVYRGKDPDAIISVIRDTMRRLGGIPPGAVAMVWRGPGHTAWEKVRLDAK